MSQIGENVGLRIREAREAKGLTQAALAESVALAVETISRMERGRQSPRLDHLAAVARVLGTTAGRLVDGDGGLPREEALPREISRVVNALRGLDDTGQRRIRKIVELALERGDE